MKISKVGIDLIKSFEGCQLKAYRCPAGVWTIGWGTTEPIGGVKIHEGMTITQKQADDLLIKNLIAYEDAVNKYVTYHINQNQFDALTSFAYNCGTGALKTSTLLEKLNKGDIQGAADEFPRWNKANGQVLNGLVRRRAAERDLFLKKMPTQEQIKCPQWQVDALKSVSCKLGLDTSYWTKEKLVETITIGEVMGLLNKII